jgi:tripartite-type tricarboxylate transporter receptor subunit TctC
MITAPRGVDFRQSNSIGAYMHTARILAAVAFAAALPAAAQQFPSRQMQIVVPFPTGGILDTQARLIGAELQKRLGQAVVVDNRPGAGGAIGLQHFARQEADGHTLLSGASPQAMGELFLKSGSFQPGKDVASVTSTVYAPYVIITSTQVPAKTMKQYVAYAKANPGKLNFAVVPNSGQHIDTLDFLNRAAVKLEVVNYQGGAAALRAILANESQGYFGAALGLEENVKAGKLQILAVTSAKRFAVLPDVPTVKEALGIDFDTGVTYGMFTVPATPNAVVDRLNREIVEILHKTDVGDRLRKQSYEIRTSTPAEYSALLVSELRRGAAVARAAGIQAQ